MAENAAATDSGTGPPSPVGDAGAPAGALDRRTLRFVDPALERAFGDSFFRSSLPSVRLGHVLGAALWVVWGFIVPDFLAEQRSLDLVLRYGVFVPLALGGLALTFARGYRRIWQLETAAVILVSGVAWIAYTDVIRNVPFDFGYVGLILIMVFSYTLIRMRFLSVAACSTALVAVYLAETLLGRGPGDRPLIAVYYLASFWLLGLIASYTLEWLTRLLFLRERQLDSERARSEALLRNILPQAIVERLKARRGVGSDAHLAQAHPEVSVLFADAVAFTTQSERTSPDHLVGALDRLFRRFDELAARLGLEKIKTVGDAYMAVAGAPDPRDDHARVAVEMGLGILEIVRDERWPSGDPVEMRIGIASGPAVAGVIGYSKFAYDLWGDTVNLASRLESSGEPGRILVSDGVAERLGDRYELEPPRVVDLKGKGPTSARFVLDRRAAAAAEPSARETV